MQLADLTPEARAVLERQTIELPSWAFGNSGTRFKVFSTPGTPRDAYEKLADAAQVNRHTGVTPRVSLHIPWDEVDDYDELRSYAAELGLQIGAINSNVFQKDEYRLGSLCNPDPAVRRKAVQDHLHCIEVMRATGSKELKIWLADGLNYPGQDSIADRQARLTDGLAEIYAALRDDERMLLEYKLFEPGLYATDIPDWGTALKQCVATGERAYVVLDTGHHAQATNVEFIVVQLLQSERLGAFDFNSRFYADDDLMVGAADPFQLFRIMNEMVQAAAVEAWGQRPNGKWAVNLMLDQGHNIEDKIPAEIRSVMNVQEATAKALLVDRDGLGHAQLNGDVLEAFNILMEAYNTDVRPLLAELRETQGLDPDPFTAFLRSGYLGRVATERVGGQQASWGA